MPIKHAAEKALRQTKKRHARNLAVIRNLKDLGIDFRQAIEKKDKNKAAEAAKKIIKGYDKAVANGYIKKNTAGRKKSRLALKLNVLMKT